MSFRRKTDHLLRKFEHSFETYNRIEVSRSALLHNFDLFHRLSGKQIIPVLKSNAYGHGLEIVANILKLRQFPYLAVDGYFEALRIREVSRQPVLIMGMIKPANFKFIKYLDFAFVVHDLPTISALGRTGRRINVHLELNTGMNRHGVKASELNDLLALIKTFPNLTLEGVMTHLADADGSQDNTVTRAVRTYDAMVQEILGAGFRPVYYHVGQTAGSLREKSDITNAIRLGIGLYGINPFPPGHSAHKSLKNLKPALKLMSTVSKVIELEKGDKVSYNYTFTAPRAMRIGVLPLGYYEGVNRALSNTGTVLINGQSAPIVGRVCMNHTMINLENTDMQVDDEVMVYSNNPADPNSISAIALNQNLFNYSLLTSLNADVRRVISR